MKRREFLRSVAGGAAVLAMGPSGVLAAEGKRPNVLFVAIDDLNDWVGCFGGNSQVKTPNIDKFNASGGMVMGDAHCSATVCGPSRSSLLTGVHCYKTGVYSNNTNLKDAPKAKGLATIPEYFSRHGYHSLSMGKIFHKHFVSGRDDMDEGQWAFDQWLPSPPGAGPASKKRPVNGLLSLDGGVMKGKGLEFDWGQTAGNDEKSMEDYKVCQWGARQFSRDFKGKPFFMALGISKPHLPWFVPKKYFDMYPLDEIRLPKTLASDRDDIIKADGRPIYPLDTTRWARVEKYGVHKQAVQAYLATITFVDDCIGLLLDGLAASKHAENTIVIIWGDHGWHLVV